MMSLEMPTFSLSGPSRTAAGRCWVTFDVISVTVKPATVACVSPWSLAVWQLADSSYDSCQTVPHSPSWNSLQLKQETVNVATYPAFKGAPQHLLDVLLYGKTDSFLLCDNWRTFRIGCWSWLPFHLQNRTNYSFCCGTNACRLLTDVRFLAFESMFLEFSTNYGLKSV